MTTINDVEGVNEYRRYKGGQPDKSGKKYGKRISILDAGHTYGLLSIGKDIFQRFYQRIKFVKREGPNYPGNVGEQDGIVSQDMIRVLIDRAIYKKNQISCAETDIVIASLRTALFAYEVRAARCRGAVIDLPFLEDIEQIPTCEICGHIFCDEKRHEEGAVHWSENKEANEALETANKAFSDNPKRTYSIDEICRMRAYIADTLFRLNMHHDTDAVQQVLLASIHANVDPSDL